MKDVIKGCKNHQHQDDRQPDPESQFLGPLRQWPPADRLDGVEQKVTPIEQGDGKQVQQPYRDRKDGGEVKQRRKTGCRHLA